MEKQEQVTWIDFDIKKELPATEMAGSLYGRVPATLFHKKGQFKQQAKNYFLVITDEADRTILEIDTTNNTVYVDSEFIDPLWQTEKKIQEMHDTLSTSIESITGTLLDINRRTQQAKKDGELKRLAPELQRELLKKQNIFTERMNALSTTYNWPFKELIRDIEKELRKAQED